MSKNYPEIAKDLSHYLAKLREVNPAMMTAFQGLSKEGTVAKALSEKQKELIALGIAIAARCDGCIAFHVQKAIKLGTTLEEFTDTLSVAVYMGGGPSLMYAAEAMKAYEQFTSS